MDGDAVGIEFNRQLNLPNNNDGKKKTVTYDDFENENINLRSEKVAIFSLSDVFKFKILNIFL